MDRAKAKKFSAPHPPWSFPASSATAPGDVQEAQVPRETGTSGAAAVALGRCSRRGPTSSLPGVVPPPSLESCLPATLVRPCTSRTAGSLRRKVSVSAAASTTMTSRGPNFPARISCANGFSIWLCTARRSGRAPNTGSKPTSASRSSAFGVSSMSMSRALSRSRRYCTLQRGDVVQLFAPERVEHHDIVNAVDELGGGSGGRPFPAPPPSCGRNSPRPPVSG